GQRLRLGAHTLEVRGFAYVCRLRIPSEGRTFRRGQRLPPFVTLEAVVVARGEHVLGDRRGDDLLDLLLGGPDVGEVDVVAVRILAECVLREIEVHRARECVGDHQRRRGQVVHLHVRIDPALEVAVTGQYRHGGEIVLLNGVGDVLG